MGFLVAWCDIYSGYLQTYLTILLHSSIYRIVSVSLTGVPVACQWHAPVLVERAGSYLYPWWRVATGHLGFVDAPQHVDDHGWVEAGIGEVFETGRVLDIAFDDLVKHFVGR